MAWSQESAEYLPDAVAIATALAPFYHREIGGREGKERSSGNRERFVWSNLGTHRNIRSVCTPAKIKTATPFYRRKQRDKSVLTAASKPSNGFAGMCTFSA